MLVSAFFTAIRSWLRVPPGASVRKANGKQTTTDYQSANEYVEAILDITVDDICIGEHPLSITYKNDTPNDVAQKLQFICDECNTIVKDVTRDLLSVGYSVYDAKITKKNRLILLPYLDEVEFYMTDEKKIVLYSVESSSKVNLKDKLVFINYNKSCLEKVDEKDKKIKFRVNPLPMQLKNAETTLQGISNAEQAVSKYRALLRPVRWVNVDIGASQGDTQKQVEETVSAAVNANSASLDAESAVFEFDDNLSVIPNRKGLGKPEVASDIPSANIKDLADLDYYLGKLNLIMKFPSSYMDFSKAIGETAVSLLRGDLRYSKLCKAASSKVVETFNAFIQSSKLNDYEPVFNLTTIPSSEDDDVVDSMDKFTDLVDKVNRFVLGDGDEFSANEALHRLKLLQDLFATSTNSPTITKWFEEFREYIEKFAEESESSEELDEDDLSSGGMDEEFDAGPDEDIPSGPGEDDFSSGGMDEEFTPSESSEDIEIIEPQST